MGFVENVNKLSPVANSVKDLAPIADDIHHIRETYVGAFDSYPTTRYDGTQLEKGDFFFLTTSNIYKTWNGSAWIDLTGGQFADHNRGVAYMYQHSEPNEQIVIPNGTNAFSVGNYTLEDGAELVIPDGSEYKVI